MLTLPGLKARRFLRHFSLNIPIGLSYQADYSGHYRCCVISGQKCFGRKLSPSPGVGFYILSELVILPYSFVKMDLLFYLTMEKSRPTRTGFSTQFSDKSNKRVCPAALASCEKWVFEQKLAFLSAMLWVIIWGFWIFAIGVTRSADLSHNKNLLGSQTKIGNIT